MAESWWDKVLGRIGAIVVFATAGAVLGLVFGSRSADPMTYVLGGAAIGAVLAVIDIVYIGVIVLGLATLPLILAASAYVAARDDWGITRPLLLASCAIGALIGGSIGWSERRAWSVLKGVVIGLTTALLLSTTAIGGCYSCAKGGGGGSSIPSSASPPPVVPSPPIR
jgi:hypothetical protein